MKEICRIDTGNNYIRITVTEATSRMKDFFDIYYLSSMFDFDGRKLQEAVWQTIQHRGTPYEADYFNRIVDFEQDEFLITQWSRFQPSMQMELPDFSVVIHRLQDFLEPIFEAILNEEEFFGKWIASKSNWRKYDEN